MTVSNRDLARLADETATDLAQLSALVHHGLLQRMAEASAGPAISRPERPISGGYASDPTAAAALGRPDLAGMHRGELARILGACRSRARRLLDIAALYPEPHPAALEDRAALDRLNGGNDPGCENCARTIGPAGGPRWEPPLPEPYVIDTEGLTAWLCQWCAEALGRWGRLPTVDELERHHAGQMVRWPADVPRPA